MTSACSSTGLDALRWVRPGKLEERMHSVALRWRGPYTLEWLLTSPESRVKFRKAGIYLWIEGFRGSPQGLLPFEESSYANLIALVCDFVRGGWTPAPSNPTPVWHPANGARTSRASTT